LEIAQQITKQYLTIEEVAKRPSLDKRTVLAESVTRTDFSGKSQPTVNEQIEAIKKLIESQKR
jgi:hypothetical protein